MRTLKLTIALAILSVVIGLNATDNVVICDVNAATTDPNNFCFQTSVLVYNNTGSTLTNKPVRVEIDTDNIISAGQLNSQGWDFKPLLGSVNNNPYFTAQDVNSADSGYWLVVDSIDDGQVLEYLVYHGNIYQKFDNGFWLGGYASPLIVPDDTTIDLLGSSAYFDLIFSIDSLNPQSSSLITKTSGTDGYVIGYRDNGGVLEFYVSIDGSASSACSTPITETGRQKWFVVYNDTAGTDITIYKNGTSILTCSGINQGNINNSSGALIFGNSVSDTYLHYVALYNAGTKVAGYSFDGGDLNETDNTSPSYAGTFTDITANNNDGTYSFSEDQSNISVVVNPPVISHHSNFPSVNTNNNRFDGVFSPGQITIQPTPTGDSLLAIVFSNTDTYSGATNINLDGPRFAIAFGIGMMLMVPAVYATRFIPLGLILFLTPVALGAASGWYNPIWALLMIIALPLAWWGSTKALETSVS